MRYLARLLATCMGLTCMGWATQSDRISASIIGGGAVAELKGSVPPLAQSQFDKGRVDPSTQLDYVTLQIAPSPEQKAALERLLKDQQDPSSPQYHRWITPEQYADRFGLSQKDAGKITNWLRSQGLKVLQVARSRNWVAFSGSVGQVESLFHTEIHHFNVNGEEHYANAWPVSVPQAVAGIVTYVRGLDDFRWKPTVTRRVFNQALSGFGPDYSTGGGGNFLAPDDIATIYDLKSLYTAGYDGTGQTLVIVGQTDINMSDIDQFRSGFGLSKNDPVKKLYGSNPGITGDLVEADLDLEWSGAVARNAKIVYAFSTDVFNSLQQVLNDKSVSPAAISMSYGGCEPVFGQSQANAIQTVIQQANSQGVTFMASTGDSGAAACDQGHNPPATQGLAVNLPASVPETTAVGGGEFNEGGGTYWGSNGADFGSALSYIPEEGWNDTPLGFGFASTGGGKSIFFLKPAWQNAPGVPNDKARDIPDITLSASADHDGYIFCTNGSCAGGIVNAVNNNSIVGGTSASSPVFAGMVTLLNHYLAKNKILPTPLGNINSQLYQLSQTAPSGFHDIAKGNNIVPCQAGTTGCPSKAPFQYGYSAGVGYDQVTGLGSVDGFTLVSLWNGGTKISTSTTASVSASQIYGGSSVKLSGTISHASGGSPTGTVTFYNGATKIGTAQAVNSSGVATLTTSSLSGGVYSITAIYSGDGVFQGSTSLPVGLTVLDFSMSPASSNLSITDGSSGQLTLTLAPIAGFSKSVSFSCVGLPSQATCTFSPATVTLNGASSKVVVTIQTTAPSAQLQRDFLKQAGIYYALLLPGFLGFCFAGKATRRRQMASVIAVFVVIGLSAWMVGCGGGGSSSGNPGTPKGTTSALVMATTGDTPPTVHNATVVLTVQ